MIKMNSPLKFGIQLVSTIVITIVFTSLNFTHKPESKMNRSIASFSDCKTIVVNFLDKFREGDSTETKISRLQKQIRDMEDKYVNVSDDKKLEIKLKIKELEDKIFVLAGADKIFPTPIRRTLSAFAKMYLRNKEIDKNFLDKVALLSAKERKFIAEFLFDENFADKSFDLYTIRNKNKNLSLLETLLREKERIDFYRSGRPVNGIDDEFDALAPDSPLRVRTVDWLPPGHDGSVYHLITRSFRDNDGKLEGIFAPQQWTQVAEILPSKLLRPGVKMNANAHPLFMIAKEEGINLSAEPERAVRKIFWALEETLPGGRGVIATGHRQRIAVNYFDGEPHSVETWVYRQEKKKWEPAYFKFQNGVPVPEKKFLGEVVEKKCMQCHYQGDHQAPTTNPIPFQIWKGIYGSPQLNGWKSEFGSPGVLGRPGVTQGLDPNYSPDKAFRRNTLLPVTNTDY